ncbi:MAG: hypothetical protein GQ475_01870 [Methylococcaceae bacterium]|nr:hypothetical protein [Methylococcaceae bacterium]
MNKYLLKLSFATLILFSANLLADDECKDGLTAYTVVGTVDTKNISPIIQAGQVTLELTAADGTVDPYTIVGAIIGRVTSQGAYGLPATLNHNMIFEGGEVIETTDDLVISLDLQTECSFAVTEEITDIWGTEQFKKASGNITAEGTVNLCDGDNHNHFDLEGTICLK